MLADLVSRLIEDNTVELTSDATLLGLYSQLLLNFVAVCHLSQRLNTQQVNLLLPNN